MFKVKREYYYFENEFEITKEREDEIIEALAARIYKYGMETPAIFIGEMMKPMSFLASSLMHGVTPLLAPFIDFKTTEEYAFFFEKRANIEKLLLRLEDMIAREPRKKRR